MTFWTSVLWKMNIKLANKWPELNQSIIFMHYLKSFAFLLINSAHISEVIWFFENCKKNSDKESSWLHWLNFCFVNLSKLPKVLIKDLCIINLVLFLLWLIKIEKTVTFQISWITSQTNLYFINGDTVTKITNIAVRIYASSFYMSQNILGWSKFFGLDQKLICILCQPQAIWATSKDDFQSVI